MQKQSFIRRGALVAVVASAALALGACSGGGTPSESGAASGAASGSAEAMPMTDIKIGVVYTTSAIPFFVAKDQGFFEKNHLNAEIVQVQNFAESAPLLQNGDMQFANAATTPIITAQSKKLPIKQVSAVQSEPGDAAKSGNQVIVAADSTIKQPLDLKGKKIATNAIGSGTYVGMLANYIKAGGKPEDVEWVVMPFSQMVGALEKGQIDGYLGSEPFTTQGLEAGMVAAFASYSTQGIDAIPSGFTDVVVVGNNEYVANNTEVVENFRKAIDEAGAWANEHRSDVSTLLVDNLGMKQEVADNVRVPTYTGKINEDSVLAVGKVMADLGLIDAVPADMFWTAPAS